MERLTSATGMSKGSLIGHLVALLVLASGPHNVARLFATVSSVLTWPVTRELILEPNRFEIRNAELLLIYLVAVFGLNLLFQTGVISIGQSASVLVGAYSVALLTGELEWSYWLALVGAMVIATAVGVLLGLPGLRLGTFTFVMVTIGYATVATDMVLEFRSITGGGDGLSGIAKPAPFDTLESYYWLLAIAAVLVYVVVHNVLRSPYGRQGKAIESNQVAASSLGISSYGPKLRAFAMASALGGLAGGLYAPLLGFIAPEAFSVNLSILFVLMVLLGGRGSLVGPVVGAIVVFRIPLAVERVTDQPGDASLLVYGLVLLLSVHFVPKGLMSAWWYVQGWLVRRRDGDQGPAPEPDPDEVFTCVTDLLRDAPRREGDLVVVDVVKRLGGVTAVGGIDLTVKPGTVHALIGPNGSGKTTLLNLISGYLRPDHGTISICGTDVTGTSTEGRAALGLSRTFQTPAVFEGMTCLENVMTAVDFHREATFPEYLVRLPRARHAERDALKEATVILEALGLGHRADDDVADLTPGERRFLELARVVAMRPSFVLLDEPAAGLRAGEMEVLAAGIRALRASGIGVLLVEHHVDFVLKLADEATVIDFGRVIASGDPAEIRHDPAVVAAYFGLESDTDSDDGADTEVERPVAAEEV
jgi:branched-chain amino acid transport system permease protein